MLRTTCLLFTISAGLLTGCDFILKPPTDAVPVGDDTYMTDIGEDDAPDIGVTEPDYPDYETTFEDIGWSCDAEAYWFAGNTEGLSTGGWLYMYQTGSSTPWNEDHPVPVYDAALDGSWTQLYLDLISVYPDPSAVVSGSTTLYECSGATRLEATLPVVLELDGADGTIAIECVVWGHNPDAAPADDCARISPYDAPRL